MEEGKVISLKTNRKLGEQRKKNWLFTDCWKPRAAIKAGISLVPRPDLSQAEFLIAAKTLLASGSLATSSTIQEFMGFPQVNNSTK